MDPISSARGHSAVESVGRIIAEIPHRHLTSCCRYIANKVRASLFLFLLDIPRHFFFLFLLFFYFFVWKIITRHYDHQQQQQPRPKIDKYPNNFDFYYLVFIGGACDGI
jgi:hypothetical protein